MDSSLCVQQDLGSLPTPYGQDAFFSDMSSQMALSQLSRRQSRGSSTHRAGSAMRVVKPGSSSSTSNSPRTAGPANRRRTLINENQGSRRYQQPVAEPFSAHARGMTPGATRPSRPVSWHPSSHIQPYPGQSQQQHYPYPQSTPTMFADQMTGYMAQPPHFSPMAAACYSNNTSPASNFSPLPHGLDTSGANQYVPNHGWDSVRSSQHMYTGYDIGSQYASEQLQTLNDATAAEARMPDGLDWNSFVMQGFNNTTPPTPESFPQPQGLRTLNESDASVPYQPLEEQEEEGEVLVGMGLYDTPEKCYDDPQLDNYRSTVTSLLGSKFRPQEPQGRGLKLEETWEPPQSENDDDDDDDSDE